MLPYDHNIGMCKDALNMPLVDEHLHCFVEMVSYRTYISELYTYILHLPFQGKDFQSFR